jgi:alpha-ribazole phosphatase
MEVYLIRHTKVVVSNAICYGQSEVKLAETFYEELKLIKQQLPHDIEIVYTSPSQRCKQLATELVLNKTIITHESLLEMNFGNWELIPWDEINPNQLNTWMENFVNERPPMGENLEELYERVSAFLDEIKNLPLKKMLIVAHAGVIRCVWAYLLQIPLQNIFKIPIGFGEVFVFKLLRDERHNSIIKK